jgi:hypothetical protein
MEGTTEPADAARSSAAPSRYVVVLKPRVDLMRTGLLSYLLLSLPLFGALYILSVPNGTWNVTLVFQLVTLLLVGLAFIQYRRTYIGVTAESLEERGFLSRVVSTPLVGVRSAVLVETYRSSSAETVHQLLLSGADGQRMLRMRGTFWHEATMRQLVATLGVPIAERNDPMTKAAFFTEYPGSAYWFENRPAIAVLAVAGGLVVILGLTLGLMAMMNIPLGG